MNFKNKLISHHFVIKFFCIFSSWWDPVSFSVITYIYSLVCVFVQLHTGMAISEGIVFSISGRGLSNIKWGCTSHHQLIVFCVYIYLHRGLRRRRRRLNMFIIYRRCWLFHSILVCVCPSIRQEQSNPP